MEFHDTEDSESDEEVYSPSLDVLPPEIILHICSFLNAKFVINVLSQVSKKFKDLVQNDIIWKMRIVRRWPKKYPLVQSIEDIDWKSACIAREEHYHLWNNHLKNMRKFHLHEAHFGCVNVVHLIEGGKICASGGRDGFLKLWSIDPANLIEQPFNVEFVNLESCIINSRQHANAWLWDITYDKESKHLYTASFDCTIKSWDLSPEDPLLTYDLTSPILCLAFNESLLASGCFGRTVAVFDPRAEREPVMQHILHKRAVLSVIFIDRYIVTGSEDKSIIVYDKVAGKILKKIELEGFPLSMSYGDGQLLAGDVNGSLHVIDPIHGNFDLLHSFPSGHAKKVTGLQHSLGSIITCSTDKTIRVLEPHLDPEPIAVLESTNEVSRISACDTVLACANVDDSISIWIPDYEFQ